MGDAGVGSGSSERPVDRLQAGRLWLDPVSSTNMVAAWLGQRGWVRPLWVLARTQTGGVGRRGSRWESPAGGLWASLLIPVGSSQLGPTIAGPRRSRSGPAALDWLPLLMAGAVSEVTRGWCGLPARLKWPNDVLIGGRKLAGVLASAQTAAGALRYIVIGVGVNVNVDPAHLPPALQDQVTSIWAWTGRRWSLPLWLDHLEEAWWSWYALWQHGQVEALRQSVMERWFTPGQPVLILPKENQPAAGLAGRGAGDGREPLTPAEPFLAQLVGIDEQARAVVWLDGQPQELDPSRYSLRLLNLARPSSQLAGAATIR